MIEVSRLNGKSFILNCELIKFIEETPDTVITLTTGEKFMVLQKPAEIIEKSMNYRKKMYQEPIRVERA